MVEILSGIALQNVLESFHFCSRNVIFGVIRETFVMLDSMRIFVVVIETTLRTFLVVIRKIGRRENVSSAHTQTSV
jgi:hypothetical protein